MNDEPIFEIKLPDLMGQTPETQLACRVLVDAVAGEQLCWPDDHSRGWQVIVHLAKQIPGSRLILHFPSGGEIEWGIQ